MIPVNSYRKLNTDLNSYIEEIDTSTTQGRGTTTSQRPEIIYLSSTVESDKESSSEKGKECLQRNISCPVWPSAWKLLFPGR